MFWQIIGLIILGFIALGGIAAFTGYLQELSQARVHEKEKLIYDLAYKLSLKFGNAISTGTLKVCLSPIETVYLYLFRDVFSDSNFDNKDQLMIDLEHLCFHQLSIFLDVYLRLNHKIPQMKEIKKQMEVLKFGTSFDSRTAIKQEIEAMEQSISELQNKKRIIISMIDDIGVFMSMLFRQVSMIISEDEGIDLPEIESFLKQSKELIGIAAEVNKQLSVYKVLDEKNNANQQ